MQTALESLPVAESNDWTNFCTLLSSRFGQIVPDAEFWDHLNDLKLGSLTAAQYVHKMRYCFNGVTVVPLSNGDKIHRFMAGLNPRVKEEVLTAPFGMGDGAGKWLDPDQLMQYTVLQAQASSMEGLLQPTLLLWLRARNAFLRTCLLVRPKS
ncbi:hypothetical protein ABBQ32_004446 [Trebouxia sp. C0010 RCD-2024]